MKFNKFVKIFKGFTMLKERYKILKKVASTLKKIGGVNEIVKQNKRDATSLVFFIASNFYSFNDICKYNKIKVYFLKKAQLVVRDLSYETKMKKIDKLTVLPDYRIPAILKHFGILKYSKKLNEKIAKGKLLKYGSKEEIEIRASSVYSCHVISKLAKVKSYELDFYLWLISRNKKLKYHKVRGIYY